MRFAFVFGLIFLFGCSTEFNNNREVQLEKLKNPILVYKNGIKLNNTADLFKPEISIALKDFEGLGQDLTCYDLFVYFEGEEIMVNFSQSIPNRVGGDTIIIGEFQPKAKCNYVGVTYVFEKSTLGKFKERIFTRL